MHWCVGAELFCKGTILRSTAQYFSVNWFTWSCERAFNWNPQNRKQRNASSDEEKLSQSRASLLAVKGKYRLKIFSFSCTISASELSEKALARNWIKWKQKVLTTSGFLFKSRMRARRFSEGSRKICNILLIEDSEICAKAFNSPVIINRGAPFTPWKEEWTARSSTVFAACVMACVPVIRQSSRMKEQSFNPCVFSENLRELPCKINTSFRSPDESVKKRARWVASCVLPLPGFPPINRPGNGGRL